MLELDPVARRVGEHTDELVNNLLNVAAQGKGVGVSLAEEVDRPARLAQIGVVVEIRPDAAFVFQNFRIGSIPGETRGLEQHRRILVVAGRHRLGHTEGVRGIVDKDRVKNDSQRHR